jgi:alkaline phosphatase
MRPILLRLTNLTSFLLLTFLTPTVLAQNVILIIGDGMDDHQITMARNYVHGAKGQLALDTLPIRGAVQVVTLDHEDPTKVIYVADSANSATAIATGQVTSRGRISTSADTDRDFQPVTVDLKRAGYAVGIVTTASVTDATPAVFMANVAQRFCENPDMMVQAKIGGNWYADCEQDLIANGGKGSISEQIANSSIDLVLGGGSKHFLPNAEGSDITVLQKAQASGYLFVDSLSALEQAVENSENRLLGLFSPSTMPVRWQATGGVAADEPEPSLLNHVHEYLGDVTLPAPVQCEANPSYGNTPPLAAMTESAIRQLQKRSEKGFFLMIESASIDKQSHARRPCGQIGELQQLDESLKIALDFAAAQPDTLILVTADHGQAAQIIPNNSLFNGYGIPVYTPGRLQRLITPEGAIMAMNYATNDFQAEEHTGVNIPIFANEQGRDLVPAFMMQSDIYGLIKRYLLPESQ